MKTTAKFEGGAELARAFEQLSARVSKKEKINALEAAAEPMRRRMSQLAPREEGKPDLADNIVISPAKSPRGNPTAASVAVGPAADFFYGFYQEFGTAFHSAQAFVRPAFDTGVMRAISDIANAMWTVLASRGISRSGSSSSTPQGGPGGGLL